MHSPETIPGYAAIRSAEYRSEIRAERYVEWAQDMLEAGFDAPALLSLAIADPPYFTPDLTPLFDQVANELGIEPLTMPQALILEAQEVAAEVVERRLAPARGAEVIAGILAIGRCPRGFGHWQQIDEASWCDYCRAQTVHDGETLEDAIVREASQLLGVDWRAATY